MPAKKIELSCPDCRGSSRKGLLWLGGSDWLECPTCEGSGIVMLLEQRFQAKVQQLYIPHAKGLSVHNRIIMPTQTSVKMET